MHDSFFKNLWQIIKDAGSGFTRHRVLKLSASLGFYTIFTIGPMLLVIIFIANIFWRRQAVEGTILSQISGVIGEDASLQLQDLIKSASIDSNSIMAVVGFAVLLFAATTIFTDMQDSMNSIWNLKVKPGRSWQQKLKNRFMSFCIVAGLGVLLLIFLILSSILEGFMSSLKEMFPQIAIGAIYVLNLLMILLTVASLFAIIYKVLPDAVIQWKDVTAGALFASVLFMTGRFGITIYLNNRNPGSTYGPAGSLIILLLWIYYSAIVLYFGAEFTKAYYLKRKSEIIPRDFAEVYEPVRHEISRDSAESDEDKEV
jgi:membrane protein